VIRLVLDPATGEGNLSRNADQSLVDDDGLETVLTVSLWTDAQAPADVLPPGEDRRGYWADRYDAEEPGLVTGSLIWTVLEYEPLTDAALARVQHYADEALAWMVAAGAADRIECTVERVAESAQLTVRLYKPNQPNSPYTQTWELHFAVH
jgi:phage gp46-like protein